MYSKSQLRVSCTTFFFLVCSVVNVINNLKLQYVYAASTPQHRIVLNQLNNSTLSNYYIATSAFRSPINNPEWHYLMMRQIGKTITNHTVYCPYCDDNPAMEPYGNHASSCPSKGHRNLDVMIASKMQLPNYAKMRIFDIK